MTKKTIPAISIVIPMYNAEKYIAECLDSILAQTFDDYEVIIVDDCSMDKSAAVVESYAPKFKGKLQLVRSKVNSGGRPGIPRNVGMQIAIGEYLMFVDSDDAITETALEELYSTAKKFDADALHCGRWYVSFDEVFTTDKKYLKEESWEPIERVIEPEIIPDDLAERIKTFSADKFWGGTVSNFVKRQFIMESGIMFPPHSVSEDFIFKFQVVCLAKKFLRSPSVFYIWRNKSDSTSRAMLSASERIKRWGASTLHEIGILDEFMDKFDLLRQNSEFKYAVFDLLMRKNLPHPHQILPIYAQIPAHQLDGLIRRELEQVKDKTALTAFLFARMNIFNVNILQQRQLIQKQQQQIQQLQAQLQQMQQFNLDTEDIFK